MYGDSTLMDDLDHMVFTNAIFFTRDKITEVLNQIGASVESRCMELTRELIFDILHPKLLVCFSVNDVFDKLINSIRRKDGFNEKLTIRKFKPFHIKHTCAITQFNGTTILGIPHPSGAHGVLASLPAIVRIINDLAKDEEIEKVVATKELFLDSYEVRDNMVEESQLKNRSMVNPTTERTEKTVEKRFKLFKAQIESNGADSCSLLYGGKLLNYEFYTKKDAEGKHLKTPDRIAVDILLEGNDYVIRVGTRRNDQEIIRKMANAFDDRFTPGDTELTGPHWHVHAKFAQGTPDDEIIKNINDLLMRINYYRNGKLSSK